jgi:5-methylcytosine-specific restriction protein A
MTKAAVLQGLWSEHLASLGIAPWLSADEADVKTYHEGDRETIPVSQFERDSDARKAYIKHYGISCSVCGMDFGSVYSPLCA